MATQSSQVRNDPMRGLKLPEGSTIGSSYPRVQTKPECTLRAYRQLPDKERDIDLLDPDVRKVLRELAFGRRRWPAFFYGPAGTGKTCAALTLLDYAAGKCRYDTLGDIERTLIDFMRIVEVNGTPERAIFVPGFGNLWTETTWWRCWRDLDLVVVDEIGARKCVSDHQYLTLKRAIDGREGKPAVFISNLTPRRIAELYDDRIASRLGGGTVIPFVGNDRRLASGGDRGYRAAT